MKLVCLIYRRFGRLIVIEQLGKDKWKKNKWLCICDCGKETIVQGYSLRSGNTKSCGCLQKEITVKIMTKHGHGKRDYKTKTYLSWTQIIQRCTNVNNKKYKDYGDRSITVCRRWRKFINFLKDMGEVPEGYQIDRINNHKGYYKSNCRWVTPKQNSRNRRKNHIITFDGKTQCLSAWAEELNIHAGTLRNRICELDWSIEKALTSPVRKIKIL